MILHFNFFLYTRKIIALQYGHCALHNIGHFSQDLHWSLDMEIFCMKKIIFISFIANYSKNKILLCNESQ